MPVLEIVFWVAAGLLVYTHVGYPLAAAGAAGPPAPPADLAGAPANSPSVSLIIAAHDEEAVIAAKVAERPRARLPARAARGDRRLRRLDRPHRRARARGRRRPGARARRERQGRGAERGGRARAAASCSRSPTRTRLWRPGRAARARRPVRRPERRLRLRAGAAARPGRRPNQEGAYWRYELACARSSRALAGVTAGNGAIYAVRRDAYVPLGPAASHDLSFPFMLAKRGLRAVYAPAAVAEEKMVATTEGEFARKRRMMRGIFDEVVGDGMLSPRGYGPLYAFEIASHRVLRYASPFLHLVALGGEHRAARRGHDLRGHARGPAAAAVRGGARRRACRCSRCAIARYYVLDHRLDRGRPLGPAPRAAPRAPGRRRRGRGEAGAARPACIAGDRAAWSASPLLALAAIAIKLDSRGPVLYRARRVGRDGGRVRASDKLRTMHTGNDPVGVGTPVLARRSPGDARRRRSCAASRSTSCRTCST